MKIIPLSRGKVAIVDDADFEELSKYKWCFSGSENGYAVRRLPKSQGGRLVYMHRVIAKPREDEEVDHINRDKLDNSRANLRCVNSLQNKINRRIHPRNKTGVKGVYTNPLGKYVVNISVNNRTKYLGTFDTLEEAEKCREQGCLKFYGVHYKN